MRMDKQTLKYLLTFLNKSEEFKSKKLIQAAAYQITFLNASKDSSNNHLNCSFKLFLRVLHRIYHVNGIEQKVFQIKKHLHFQLK